MFTKSMKFYCYIGLYKKKKNFKVLKFTTIFN